MPPNICSCNCSGKVILQSIDATFFQTFFCKTKLKTMFYFLSTLQVCTLSIITENKRCVCNMTVQKNKKWWESHNRSNWFWIECCGSDDELCGKVRFRKVKHKPCAKGNLWYEKMRDETLMAKLHWKQHDIAVWFGEIWVLAAYLQVINLTRLGQEPLAQEDQRSQPGLLECRPKEPRRIEATAGKLLMCLACLTLSLCGHHLLRAYHGPRLKTTGKTLDATCVVMCVCVCSHI